MLMNLPNEILQTILAIADTDSKLACWNTCKRFRELLRSKAVVSRLKLSGELKKSAIELAPYATHLCLSALLTPHTGQFPFNIFENLQSLDLREADTHLLIIHQACTALPHLKSLSVVFHWFLDTQSSESSDVEFQTVLSECQNNIRLLKNISFVIYSSQVLYFDKYLHVLKLCTSLETLHIDLKENHKMELNSQHDIALGNLQIPPSLRMLSVFIHTYYYGGPTTFMRNCATAGWEHISINCNCNVIPLSMSATNAFELLHESPQVHVERIGEISWRNEWRMFDEVNEESFHLLFHPELGKLYPNIFGKLSKKIISHHPQCDHTALSERKAARLYNFCICTFPTLSSDKQSNIHTFNLDNVPIVQKTKLSIKCTHKDDKDLRKCHILIINKKYIADDIHLRYLSYLNLDSAHIICEWKAFFLCCPCLHTITLSNNSRECCGQNSYREVVQSLHALPSLRNFLCNDFTISPDELLRECAKCDGLVNIHLYFYSKIDLNSATVYKQKFSKFLKLKTLNITIGVDLFCDHFRLMLKNMFILEEAGIKFTIEINNRRHACFHFVSCHELAEDLRILG